jgi:hypothetical protein
MGILLQRLNDSEILLLLQLLPMSKERKTIPPRHPAHIYTICLNLLPSCQRISNTQLHPIHTSSRPTHPPQSTDSSRASSQQDVAETTVPPVSS